MKKAERQAEQAAKEAEEQRNRLLNAQDENDAEIDQDSDEESESESESEPEMDSDEERQEIVEELGDDDDDTSSKSSKKNKKNKRAKGEKGETVRKAMGDKKQRKMAARKKKLLAAEAAKREIPYTFECPTEHEQLLDLFQGRTASDQKIILDRIRICTHISLSADNRGKLEKLMEVLIEHYLFISNTVTKEDLEALNVTGHTLFQMGLANPAALARLCRERITIAHDGLMKRLDAIKSSESRTCFPSLRFIMLLDLFGRLFPTSDAQHAVITPASLYISHVLAQAPVKSTRELLLGLQLVKIMFKYLQPAKRFNPEVLNFLQSALVSLLSEPPTTSSSTTSSSSSSSSAKKDLTRPILHTFAGTDNSWLHPGYSPQSKKLKADPISWIALHARRDFEEEEEQIEAMELEKESKKGKGKGKGKGKASKTSQSSTLSKSEQFAQYMRGSDQFRLDVSMEIVELVRQFANLHMEKSMQSNAAGFVPVFETFTAIMDAVNTSQLPKQLAKAIKDCDLEVKSLITYAEKRRKPMRLQQRKAVPIKQYNPKFEDNYQPLVNYDPDRERAEMQKLRRMQKKELKGAYRELRKDSEFLQTERIKQQTENRIENEKKRKEIMAMLENQQASLNNLDRINNKKRRTK
eukprot:TRINITY_DN181_c2_g1_i1.p1 TRINITY_DN181_c2_g1~~TRINITY_DN181_c2_g1_i1.p1  ORF type:complete len:674 (-),score=276.34 TRINITY_DN181_c2_g1_i1:90-2003(-)